MHQLRLKGFHVSAVAAVLLLVLTSSSYAATATDLGVRVTAPSFRVGTIGRYAVTVTNHGKQATDDDIHVTTTLAAGLTFYSVRGSVWTCSTAGQSLDCLRTQSLGRGRASTLLLSVSVCDQAVPGIVTAFEVSYAADTNSANNVASRTTAVRAGHVTCSAGAPTATPAPPATATPVRTTAPGTPTATRTPTPPRTATATSAPGNPNAPVVTNFTCNGAPQCSVSLNQSFTLQFSVSDANGNASSWSMTATRDDGVTSDAADDDFEPPTGQATVPLDFPAFTCDQTPCRQATFVFTVVVTDSTHLKSTPASVTITVRASGQ